MAWLGGPGGLGVPPRPHRLLLPLILHLLRALRRQAQGHCYYIIVFELFLNFIESGLIAWIT